MMIRSDRRHGLWILAAAALILAVLAAVGIALALRPVQPRSPAGIHYVQHGLLPSGGGICGL